MLRLTVNNINDRCCPTATLSWTSTAKRGGGGGIRANPTPPPPPPPATGLVCVCNNTSNSIDCQYSTNIHKSVHNQQYILQILHLHICIHSLLFEELHIRECSNNILPDQLFQVIVLEETVPRTLYKRRGAGLNGKESSTIMCKDLNIHLLPVREDC